VRGFLLGLFLIPLAVIALLSIRPGGLRQQLRNAGRRLRLAILLAGAYLAGSLGARIFLPQGSLVIEYGLPVLALVLAGLFVVLGQDQA